MFDFSKKKKTPAGKLNIFLMFALKKKIKQEKVFFFMWYF